MSRDTALKVVLGLIALSVFITPWSRELFVGDETKYAQVVREMRAGAFFLPTLEGTPFTHKPPLHFWMIDLLTYPFGVYSMWSFVLPSIAGFLALLWLMWRMEGPIAAFVCGTALMVWGSAQSARMDVTFTVTIVIAAWMLQRACGAADPGGDSPARSPAPHLLIAGVSLGIGTLIKGPMAPVIAMFLFAFEWLRRRRVPRGNYGLAIAAMIVIPMLWFVPAMMMGGSSFTHEVLVKQTAGRAVGAWVHRSPVWFYVTHAPATLFPWFLLIVIAIIAAYRRNDERAKFYVSWILAVFVPYSAMSSKLDVYMMAMIPPAALLVARLVATADQWTQRGHIANLVMLLLLLLIAVIGPFVPRALPELRFVFITLLIASIAGLIVSFRDVGASTLALGLVPLVALVYAALFLMPVVNELTSDRPLIRALLKQRVEPEQIALYTAPHLWSRDMPRALERVHYGAHPTTVIVTSRRHADEIAGLLRGYRKVDEFRILGKWFDVYRR